MNHKINDITSISIRDAINEQEETEYHLEAVFKNGEKYAIVVFDSECEDICNDVYNFINSKLNREHCRFKDAPCNYTGKGFYDRCACCKDNNGFRDKNEDTTKPF